MNQRLKVLVADDNAPDRMLLVKILADEGYDIECAADGHEAIRCFAEFRPQFVLLDVVMPGLDGMVVAEHIKENSGEEFIPIIFLTSLSEPEQLAGCIDAGGDDFLLKPYNRRILKAKMSALERVRTMHLTIQQQRDEFADLTAQLQQEQEDARKIFNKIAQTGNLDAPFLKRLISPYSIFNGDILFAAKSPLGEHYVMLGDFTGHGLPAAIGTVPLADIFYGMTQKGFRLKEIVREANHKLHKLLPTEYFCCAILVSLNFERQTMEFWNGGMPAAIWQRRCGEEPVYLESRHLPLGVIGDEKFNAESQTLDVATGDRLLMCTDGIVDATNEEGEAFGFERFDKVIRQGSHQDSTFDLLRTSIYHHIGGSSLADDVSLTEIVIPERHAAPASGQSSLRADPDSDEWSFSLVLLPVTLRTSTPLSLLHSICAEAPTLRNHAATIRTVITELYSNALEHGLMRLNSAQKQCPNGFADYYEARNRAMETLAGFIRFDLRYGKDDNASRLQIRVEDSGSGFDHSKLPEATRLSASEAYHGRGFRLLHQLCDSVNVESRGNVVTATIAIEEE